MNGYGRLLSDIKSAELRPHPMGDYLIRDFISNLNLSVDSNGNLHLKSDEGPDEKWSKGDKCMININTFNGTRYFFLEWF